MHVLFAYGTLRRGERYHALLRQSPLVSRRLTAPRYTMFSEGAYLSVVEGGRTAVVGELFSVSAEVLREVDALEEVPDHYVRRKIPTPHGPAWMYFRRLLGAPSRKRAPRIEAGDWVAFRRGIK